MGIEHAFGLPVVTEVLSKEPAASVFVNDFHAKSASTAPIMSS